MFLSPLRPLKPIQRIGYLQTGNAIRCVRSLPGFTAGRSYQVIADTVKVMRMDQRTNISMQTEDVELNAMEFALFLLNDSGSPITFMDGKCLQPGVTVGGVPNVDYSFLKLLECFDVPDVPDVARLYPDKYSSYLEKLAELEHFIRLADSSFAFREFQKDDCARAALRDGYLLAWQTGLGKTLQSFVWALLKTGWDYTPSGIRPSRPCLLVAIGDLCDQISREALNRLSIRMRPLDRRTKSIEPGFYIGSYTEITNYSDLLKLCQQFELVAVDEGTKIKGVTTKIGEGIRSLDPHFRLVVTATPVKNRLPDLFPLLWWVAGGRTEAHTGCPYAFTHADMDRFIQNHMVMERNLTKEKESRAAGYARKYIRPTARACNLHSLWTITAPWIMRRRKCDVADIVKQIPHRIVVPLGVAQLATYRGIIRAEYRDSNGRPAVGAKLTELRMAAACPHSQNLGGHRSATDYTPKIAAALSIIHEVLIRGEQVIVFSAFTEATNTLSRRLSEAKVPHLICDGRHTYAQRASNSRCFQSSCRYPVMLAGEGSMAYGNNFSKCNNAIFISKDWAYDLDEQAANRGHRLDSTKDVNIYTLLCRGTVDESIEDLLADKRTSAELVLDCESSEEDPEEVDLVQLLRNTVHNFDNNQDLPVDEKLLLSEWPFLRAKLALQIKIEA